MSAVLKSWARALGGEVTQQNVVCPGLGHGLKDRSISVRISVASPDGFIVHSFCGDDWRQCHDHVRARLGSGRRREGEPLRVHRATRIEAPNAKPDLALRIWREAKDPRGTLLETYLKSRRLELPDEAAIEAIRFHPNCPFGQERSPAMICLVRNILTNEPQGVHRTALSPDGTAVKRNGKTLRMSLGRLGDGAIKLDADDTVTQGLAIGEGVESSLSGRQMGYRPSWSAISDRGIENFPVLPGISALTIFGERDEWDQNKQAATKCASRWMAAGAEARAIWPTIGKDLNDQLMRSDA
jgi:putative DNA primase/helicase